jgi:hypothetical protein
MPFCSKCKAWVGTADLRCVSCGFVFRDSEDIRGIKIGATTATRKLFFVEFIPGPQTRPPSSGDPVEDFMANRANEGKTKRSTLFEFLSRANGDDKVLRLVYFDGKQETDISKSVSSSSLHSAASKQGIWKWGGPAGPFATLYLYGPILWEISRLDAFNEPEVIDLLEKSMPAWAMTLEEQGKRAHIPSAIREAVYMRDGGKCRNCGSTRDLHYDHILAFSKGGSDTVENLQILCQSCNLSKGSGF